MQPIFGDAMKYMLMGGGSVVAFLIMQWAAPSVEKIVVIGFVMMVLANFVNHPHFAHSYQLYYQSIKNLKAMDLRTQRRWIAVGVVVPAFLIAYLCVAAYMWSLGETVYLEVGVNVMGALVGWHYVKQGFGMLMLDAADRRLYWSNKTRSVFLLNAYACWFAAWAIHNSISSGSLWGVSGLRLPVREGAALVAAIFCVCTTLWCALRVFRSMRDWSGHGVKFANMPLLGLFSYIVTLYLWTLFFLYDSAFALLIPFFHSLQYLAVVWRYKINRLKRLSEPKTLSKIFSFAMVGLILGVVGFWFLPGLIDYAKSGIWPNPAARRVSLAMACFWLFINIHHYMIDNVLWKGTNPDMQKYLFSSPSGSA